MRNMISWSKKGPPFALNLDENFKPFNAVDIFSNILELKFQKFYFKGGEPHIKLSIPEYPNAHALYITQRYNDPKDIFEVVLAADAARRSGFKEIHLFLPYFPAARQDRVCDIGEPLTVKIFADMINNCGFESVTILSPHSEVTPALLNNCFVLDECFFVEKALADFFSNKENKEINLVCPDAGAGKRVSKVVSHLSKRFPENTINLIRCEKERDVKNGELKGFYVQAQNLNSLNTIIIDDINCMGGTFVGLSQELRSKNCGKLSLFTSHADCYDGIQNVLAYFDHYYTTNSKRDWEKYFYTFNDRFTCLKINL